MAKKAPALFRKPLPETLFEKRLLKHLEQPADRDFLRSCFTLTDGVYTFSAELDKKGIQRLKVLAKAIKANRQWSVNVLPLGAAALVVAGFVVFITIFMNPVLENAIERGLEGLFEARVRVDNFRLNLFRFTIGIDAITIADRDSPMKNLLEMGRTRLRLNSLAVLQGKIYIEEIRADALRFGTPRTVSGALPDRPPKKRVEKKPAAEIPPLIDLENFDAMALINREYDKLRTIKLYDEAMAFYTASTEKWTAQVEDVKKQTADVQAATQPFLSFNINNIDIRDPATIQRMRQVITDGQRALDTVKSAVNTVNTVTDGVKSDIDAARQLEASARTAISGDLDHLKSYLDFQGGGFRELIEPSIREILTGTALNYISYGERALEALEKVKALSAKLPKTEKKPKKAAFKGRNVVFASQRYPFFYLGILASDFTINDWRWAFDLRGVSSDPDLSGRPVDLKLSLNETSGSKRSAAFSGSADFRSAVNERFSAALSGANFPVDISGELQRVGIGGFSGSAAFSLDASGRRDGSVTVGGDVAIQNPGIYDPSGTVAKAVASAVDEVAAIDLGLRYSHPASGSDDFTLSTNLGDLILDALKKMVAAYAKKAMEELERTLREYITSYTKGKISPEQLDTLFSMVQGDKAALTQLQNGLQERLAETERKIRGGAEETVEKAVDEAKQQADAAAAEAQRKAAEAANEARKQAEEAKRKAEEEARRRAEEEARKALRKLPF